MTANDMCLEQPNDEDPNTHILPPISACLRSLCPVNVRSEASGLASGQKG
jgi:hypothetical protein